MNTNSNTYTVIYSIILVVVVAAVLAFAAMFLKPTQEANVKKDTISQILTAATVQGEDILATYQQEIEAAILVDINGNKVGELSIEDCEVYDNAGLKKQTIASEKALPVYIFKNGITVVPCYGAGLWGPIWGYIALDADMNTVKGIVLDHQGETPGLGAEIATPKHQAMYPGKTIYEGDAVVGVTLKKGGADKGNLHEVDAITGGTKTSDGVSAMIKDCLVSYQPYFAASKQSGCACCEHKSNELN